MIKRPQIVKTIEKTIPAVVSIIIKKDINELKKELKTKQRKKIDGAIPITISEDRVDVRGMVQIDGGSGFFVDKSGIVLTNKHVVSEPGSTHTVVTSDNEEYPAKLIAHDPINDVAILKVTSKKNFPYLKFGDSSKLHLGEQVLTFGNALGLFQGTVSLGIISGLSRSITARTDGMRFQEMRGLIQTDAAINPGNSGGPLTDTLGNVIGINTAIIAGAQNICFAIPIHTAKRDLEELKKFGKIRRPVLGINYILINKDFQEKMKLKLPYGALVEREYPFEKAVHPKSPADKAGIKEGDIITEWNGKKVTEEKGILDYLENSEVGEKISLTILRKGKEIKIKLILGERK